MKEENNDGMTHKDMTIEYKVSSFISLHNDISKNLLLPNVGTLNVLGNKGDEPNHVSQVSTKSRVTSTLSRLNTIPMPISCCLTKGIAATPLDTLDKANCSFIYMRALTSGTMAAMLLPLPPQYSLLGTPSLTHTNEV
jgi:hypothetical protein